MLSDRVLRHQWIAVAILAVCWWVPQSKVWIQERVPVCQAPVREGRCTTDSSGGARERERGPASDRA